METALVAAAFKIFAFLSSNRQANNDIRDNIIIIVIIDHNDFPYNA